MWDGTNSKLREWDETTQVAKRSEPRARHLNFAKSWDETRRNLGIEIGSSLLQEERVRVILYQSHKRCTKGVGVKLTEGGKGEACNSEAQSKRRDWE